MGSCGTKRYSLDAAHNPAIAPAALDGRMSHAAGQHACDIGRGIVGRVRPAAAGRAVPDNCEPARDTGRVTVLTWNT
jgi:hypothetical protein